VKPTHPSLEKPLVVLVHEESFLRLWMEKTLSKWFRLCVFSGSEEASAFARSVTDFGVLITDLDLGVSPLGGCNIARDVNKRFPNSPIFVFSEANLNDHRHVILQGMKQVKFLSKPFGALFLVREIKNALKEKLESAPQSG